MANPDSLFHVDALVVGGKPIGIVDGSCTIIGLMGYENKAVPAASGPDATMRQRVPRMIKAKVLLKPGVTLDDLTGGKTQISARDNEGPRRVMANNCVIASIGELGSGPTDIEWNVLEPYQIL
jgi:hypothetical protein